MRLLPVLLLVACESKLTSNDTEPSGTTPAPTSEPPTTDTPPVTDTDPTSTPPVVDSGTSSSTTPTGDTGTSSTPTGPLGNPSITGGCGGYSVDTWLSGYLLVPEMHVFGVYEAVAGSPGPITVEIDRPVQMTVVISSYEPVDWTIVVQPGATVDQVIVNGYEAQTVTVTDAYGVALAVPVDNRSPYTNGWFGEVPFSTSSGYYASEVQAFLVDVEAYTGIDATGFYGCYSGASFRLQ